MVAVSPEGGPQPGREPDRDPASSTAANGWRQPTASAAVPDAPAPEHRIPESRSSESRPVGSGSPVGGPPDDNRDADDGRELAELCRHASRLVAETTGPLRRIRLRRGDAVLEIEWHGEAAAPGSGTGTTVAAVVPTLAVPTPVGPPGADVVTDLRRTVPAPLVGTFYRSPEPGGPPFVEVGDRVEAGQVVGIVEAMKLMNEVVADQPGRVVEVLVRDGEPVEFGQPLIALVPA
ncbi:acetyl-CoA carboxylase biotin carboxyl carrier protein [Plantactinospora sonchi]|uniref:Biotin carboxyl carrier protein of acetyl-CoA carboxylase n=1 Tax=Plantactinospora sonchi TaxID=1544735 RepID=A0ABU7S337_9ACTN